MAFYNAVSFEDKAETCRSLARHTTDERTLRVLHSLIAEYTAQASTSKTLPEDDRVSLASSALESNRGKVAAANLKLISSAR